MIRAIRIGILIFIIGLSVFTLGFVVIPLFFTTFFAPLSTIILVNLIAICVWEIWRIRRE